MTNSNTVLFLGVAERAAHVPDGNTNLSKWNVLGLRSIIISSIFPIPLPNLYIGIALSFAALGTQIRLALIDESDKELGFIDISTPIGVPSEEVPIPTYSTRPIMITEQSWTPIFLPIGTNSIVIERPGTIDIRIGSSEGETIGQLLFILVDPPPLEPNRIAAIRSDPAAMKALRIAFGCRSCDAKVRGYAALERNNKLESEGWTWYANLPDVFTCTCGKTTLSLETARRNMHGLLGIPFTRSENIELVPLYEQESLAKLRKMYIDLLYSKPREEELQNFLERNPVLLHIFPAVRLFTKPPILTHFFADFAIVTPQKELLLIEIEKTTTRLIKKDGGIAADLSHAFDQVHSWLHVVDEHRLAAIDAINIDRIEVSAVRGIVIAGRDLGYDSLHLRRMKGQDRGRITLFTYDDLLFALDSLISRMSRL